MALQLPAHPDDCLCVFHQGQTRTALEDAGELEEDAWELPPHHEADLLRAVHCSQRQRITRVVALARTHPRIQRCFVLLGDFSVIGQGDWRAWEHSSVDPMERHFAWEIDRVETDAAMLVLAARMGRVMKLVLADLVAKVNERLEAGDERAVPYASRWAAKRLGEDDRQVRKALERLREHRIIVKVGELPGGDDRWEDGTPRSLLHWAASASRGRDFCAACSQAPIRPLSTGAPRSPSKPRALSPANSRVGHSV